MRTSYLFCLFALLTETGCATINASTCELTPADNELLHQRTRGFLAARWNNNDLSCEVIEAGTRYVRGHGCAIYTGPADGGKCPMTLDGGAFVLFDRQTLQPVDLIPIEY